MGVYLWSYIRFNALPSTYLSIALIHMHCKTQATTIYHQAFLLPRIFFRLCRIMWLY